MEDINAKFMEISEMPVDLTVMVAMYMEYWRGLTQCYAEDENPKDAPEDHVGGLLEEIVNIHKKSPEELSSEILNPELSEVNQFHYQMAIARRALNV